MEGVTLIDQMRIDEEERGTIVQAKYRSMISYDCDGDICPDPEVVAFSSGLSLPSTPSGRKLRDCSKIRDRILSSNTVETNVICALDYFEQVNKNLRKMPKDDNNQMPYILDASTGAGVPTSQYKSK